MPEDKPTAHPKKFADRYRVEHKIGEGAHATTWRGWDERLERPVAVKMLHARLANDPVFVARFQAEAKVAASVSQSNVVDVYDFGQEDGTLYIVMQFVDGEDLKAFIQRAAPLSIRDCRKIIGNVLDGLQAIHAAGIVHRDIKPQNILIGRDGMARVTDFGVADVDATAGLTGDGLTIGTVDYMAPEQAQGLPLTAAADLYSTGVILYEMLTGTLPFHGETSRETMLQHINAQLTPPSVRLPNHGISSTIDAVMGQSLAKDPSRRFGSARAMKQAVGQAFSASVGSRLTQATTVMQAAPPSRPAPQEYRHQPVAPGHDEGAGLSSAFRGIIWLLVVGAIGVAIWAGFQFLDSDRFDFDFPSFGGQDQATQTPASENEQDVPIEPTNPPAQQPQTEAPIAPEATETLPPVTAPPVPETEVPPIEPMDPDGEEDIPDIEPSGYDDRYRYS